MIFSKTEKNAHTLMKTTLVAEKTIFPWCWGSDCTRSWGKCVPNLSPWAWESHANWNHLLIMPPSLLPHIGPHAVVTAPGSGTQAPSDFPQLSIALFSGYKLPDYQGLLLPLLPTSPPYWKISSTNELYFWSHDTYSLLARVIHDSQVELLGSMKEPALPHLVCKIWAKTKHS